MTLLNVMRCTFWYYLYNLKHVKNTHGGVLILVKLQADVWKFGQINTCDSLVTKGKYPKTLLKVYLASQIYMGLFFVCVFLQFSSQKILLIAEYLLLLMQLKFYMVRRWKFVIRYYFNARTLTGLLAVREIFDFS